MVIFQLLLCNIYFSDTLEIGKLANETATTVDEIRKTIEEIDAAFGDLTKDAGQMLEFISDTVTPDYSRFAGVAKQYGEDADSFAKVIMGITDMTNGIQHIMDEINIAITDVAEAAQNTANRSGGITESADELTDVVKEVTEMSESQKEMSAYMDTTVKRFKLD